MPYSSVTGSRGSDVMIFPLQKLKGCDFIFICLFVFKICGVLSWGFLTESPSQTRLNTDSLLVSSVI